jgi:DNA-binding NarL/FixJ family response regulator
MTARRTIAGSKGKKPQRTPTTRIPKLNGREVKILLLLASGATKKEICNELSLDGIVKSPWNYSSPTI